jgi:ribonuclease BN (tRNA processing enzyme)
VSPALTVLGSSGMYATVERAASGYLLEAGGKRLWLDAGSGSWRNLLGVLDHHLLDGVLLTHRHPDHTSDVFQALHARHYGGSEPLPPIPLWAPQETIDRIVDYVKEIAESFDLKPISADGSVELGGARLSFVRMAHPPETLGVRVEDGGSILAYSADSGGEADFDSLATHADLFVCEATLQDADGPWHGHMRASEAAAVAARCGVRRLLLSHLPPEGDAALSLAEARREAGGVEVELAIDGRRLVVEP